MKNSDFRLVPLRQGARMVEGVVGCVGQVDRTENLLDVAHGPPHAGNPARMLIHEWKCKTAARKRLATVLMAAHLQVASIRQAASASGRR